LAQAIPAVAGRAGPHSRSRHAARIRLEGLSLVLGAETPEAG